MQLCLMLAAAAATNLSSAPTPSTTLTLPSSLPLTLPLALADTDEHAHADPPLPPSLDARILDGWLDPWPHSDLSPRGTPHVHLFTFEPAYLDRGFALDFGWTDGDEGQEYEVEAELEYAFTRRLGIVIEAPYAWLDPEEGEREHGFGDFAVVPRILLLEYDRFLLAANIEFALPTGKETRGLGEGEAAIGPALAAWIDAGHNITLQTTLGVEHGFESRDDVFTWGAAVTWSVALGSAQLAPGQRHFPPGLLSLIAEIRGEHPLDGEEEGRGVADAVLGASYSLTSHLELRGGVTFPAWKPREFDVGLIAGIIWHF